MPQPPQRHSRQPELHRTDRVGWLRAAVLGANDGIVSVSGVVVGVAASGAAPGAILTAGIAATVAGAMSMAAGEYVSVQSQADTEQADMAIERRELQEDPQAELEELARIYQARGLEARTCACAKPPPCSRPIPRSRRSPPTSARTAACSCARSTTRTRPIRSGGSGTVSTWPAAASASRMPACFRPGTSPAWPCPRWMQAGKRGAGLHGPPRLQ